MFCPFIFLSFIQLFFGKVPYQQGTHRYLNFFSRNPPVFESLTTLFNVILDCSLELLP
eukprot:UN02988